MKDSKLPMWPLYAADALMFLAVFIIALPSMRYAEQLGASQTFLCCLMVLGGMTLLLVPYWLEYKRSLVKNSEKEKESDDNFQIVFEQLSALQLMIADCEEKREKLAFGVEELKNTDATADVIAAVEDFRNSVKAKLKEQSANIDSINAAIAKYKSDIGDKLIELDTARHTESDKISELRAIVSAKLDAFDSAQATFEAAVSRYEAASKMSDDTISGLVADMDILKDMLCAANESLGDEISSLRENIEEMAKSAKKDFRDFGAIAPQAPITVSKLSGMLDKALSQASDTKESIGKLISKSAPEKLNEESQPVIDQDGTKLGDFEQQLDEEKSDEQISGQNNDENLNEDVDADENKIETSTVNLTPLEQSQELPQAKADSAPTPASKVSTDIEAAASDDADEPAEPPADENNPQAKSETSTDTKVEKKKDDTLDDINFFESADSVKGDSESAQEKSQPQQSAEIDKEISDMLFDDIPAAPAKPKKPAKGDSAITLNSLIGIGNKPYLRGDGAGLSQEKGVVMEYVEIGKWRYIIKDMDAPITFRILKNDESETDPAQSFKLDVGQKLELTLNFPQE